MQNDSGDKLNATVLKNDMDIESSFLVSIPTTLLGYRYDIKISPWSDGLTAYRSHSNEKLERIEGGIGVGLNFIEGGDAKEKWESLLPEGLLEQTELFPEHQYQMLWLAANSQEAREILSVRPLILAMICERYPVDNEKALSISMLGQRKILQHLGLASTKAALRFIDKLDLTYERTSEIFHVMKVLDARTNYFKRFSHYIKVNFSSLSLDNTHPFLTGTHLGRAIGEASNATRLKLTLCIEDSLMLGQAIGVQDPMSVIVNLKTYEDLTRLHDEWATRRNAIRSEEMKPIDADTPYTVHFSDTVSLTQIVDYYDLCKEGDEMRHCIVVYHNRIAQGRYVALRLSHPERMTVGIKIEPNKQFPYEIDQIAGIRNKLPTEETRQAVFKWLLNERKNHKVNEE
ncbi:PcfJ domain-containing protein [Vibrio agarivorans]|uniref:PcfJ domain-containing protein n=1 Tax=Vibrio agarivorans TaxID=153622 RepID=A0ABT7XZG0_9VIBR|nr:PcfJ domain-containing protein [Vibrio agarivorans]